MDKFEKAASEVIDLVEHDIRRANPEVDAVAMEKKENTLLRGHDYTDLKAEIAKRLKAKLSKNP